VAERRGEGSAADRSLRAFLQRDWERWLAEYPEIATLVGYPGLNDRWTDDSDAGIERRRRHLAESRAALKRLSRSGLSPRERLNYDLYAGLVEAATEGLRFDFDPLPYRFGMPRDLRMPMTQMDGVQTSASETLDLQPHSTVEDYEAHLKRLTRLPALVDQHLALLERGRKGGFTPCRIAIRGVPDQVRGLIPDDPLTSPLLHAFTEFPVGIPEADRSRLRSEAGRIQRDEVAPALNRLHTYLVDRYLPSCREAPGISAIPNGKEQYEYLIRWQTTTERTAREIHEIGLQEVARIRAEVDRIRVSTGFSGDLPAFLEFLRTDPRFFYATGAELVDGYRVIAKQVDPTLARLFGRLPRLPYGVVPVPEFRAPSSPAAYYISGAAASGRAGFFYANTHDIRGRPRWEMEALTFHEAVPGHHLQIALTSELEGLPEFRRNSGYTAFVEGWGLYAESLGEELGFYRDPYSKFGQLTFDTWRSARLVVDTGLHALGWTRDQAIDYCRKNTSKSETDIAVEIDRYIVWPGQALAYKMGQLKFRELRTLAEGRLGGRFDVRAFHDLLLGEGALPLDEVDRRVRAWIAGSAKSPARRSGRSARRPARSRRGRRPVPRRAPARRRRR
jgi:uncharacterized protein (DUF885 family)